MSQLETKWGEAVWSGRQGEGSGSVAGVERTQWEDDTLQSLRSATGPACQKTTLALSDGDWEEGLCLE